MCRSVRALKPSWSVWSFRTALVEKSEKPPSSGDRSQQQCSLAFPVVGRTFTHNTSTRLTLFWVSLSQTRNRPLRVRVNKKISRGPEIWRSPCERELELAALLTGEASLAQMLLHTLLLLCTSCRGLFHLCLGVCVGLLNEMLQFFHLSALLLTSWCLQSQMESGAVVALHCHLWNITSGNGVFSDVTGSTKIN